MAEDVVTERAVAHEDETEHGTGESAPAVDLTRAMIDGSGGPVGLVCSTLPVLVFVLANVWCALPMTLAVATVSALVLAGVRLRRGERLSSALGGLFGVVAAGGIAIWTGSAKGFFLINIWSSLVLAVLLFVTVLVRRPLTGLVWSAVHGGAHPWRSDARSLHAHDLATLALIAVFGAQFVVKQQLYVADATGWLGFAKIMGLPLIASVLPAAVWAFRRTTRRCVPTEEPAP